MGRGRAVLWARLAGLGHDASALRGVSRQGENVLVDDKKQPTLLGCRFYFLV